MFTVISIIYICIRFLLFKFCRSLYLQEKEFFGNEYFNMYTWKHVHEISKKFESCNSYFFFFNINYFRRYNSWNFIFVFYRSERTHRSCNSAVPRHVLVS